MEMNEYQNWTASTAVYPKVGLTPVFYCALKLNGEAGEVAEKVGKAIRDDNSTITEGRRIDLALELGDCLWYIARLADEIGFNLQEIADMNQRKLEDRKSRGAIQGSGDAR